MSESKSDNVEWKGAAPYCFNCKRIVTSYVGADGFLKCYSCGLTNMTTKTLGGESQNVEEHYTAMLYCSKCKTVSTFFATQDKPLHCSVCKWVWKNLLDDAIEHPKHYNSHPSGVECVTITEYMNFNIGNAIKYLWRAGLKGDAVEDLKKAAWYCNREIERISKAKKNG